MKQGQETATGGDGLDTLGHKCMTGIDELLDQSSIRVDDHLFRRGSADGLINDGKVEGFRIADITGYSRKRGLHHQDADSRVLLIVMGMIRHIAEAL